MTIRKSITVAEYVEHLLTLPQDYEVWGNSGYYGYEDYPFEEFYTDQIDTERRVYLTNTGA